MFKTLQSWLTPARPATAAAARRFAPQLESMHDRLTPAASVSSLGNLIIGGGPGDDFVTVTVNGSSYRVSEQVYSPFNVTWHTDIPVASVTGSVQFYGYTGNDYFRNDTALRTVGYGDDGNDTLVGGTGDDTLTGGPGGDILDAGFGSDTVRGEDGNDWIHVGDDLGTHVNVADGGTGNDTLTGTAGIDSLFGGAGTDRLDAGRFDLGRNLLDGGGGNDTLNGGDGADTLRGGTGDDLLQANGGGDSLFGGSGLDRLFGDAGDDLLDGGVGDGQRDVLGGGSGADRFRIDAYEVTFSFLFIFTDRVTVNFDVGADFDAADGDSHFS